MTKEKVFLSILIPTWNRAKTVLNLVESASIEQFSDIEIIVVDNCSDEAVFQELKRGLTEFDKVKLYRNKSNLGMVRNWNKCIEYSSGDWMTLMCSDDCFCKGAVERIHRLLEQTKIPSLIIQDPIIEEEVGFYPAGSQTVRSIRLPIASGNVWHKDVVKTVGMFDVRFEYSADAEYWNRIAYSFPVIKLKQYNAIYKRNESSYMWDTWRRDDFLSQIELISRTNIRYFYEDKLSEAEIDVLVAEGVWKTLLTILGDTVCKAGKGDIFLKYINKAWRRSNTFAIKLILLRRLSRRSLKNILGLGTKCFRKKSI